MGSWEVEECQKTNNRRTVEAEIGYFYGLEEKDKGNGCEDSRVHLSDKEGPLVHPGVPVGSTTLSFIIKQKTIK